jgi:hypothetical protein
MMSHADRLAERRLQLVQRSAELRHQLAQDAMVMAPWLGAADGVRALGWWAKRHPAWVGAAVATLAVLKPRRAVSWGLKAWSGWRMWQRARVAWDASSKRW